METFQKGPGDVLDYTIDWGDWLGTDTIIGSTYTADSGVTLSSSSVSSDATETTTWVSGGTVGTNYKVTNRIITTGGRTSDRSFYVQIVTDVEQ